MNTRNHCITLALTLAAMLGLAPAALAGKPKTETFRVFSKNMSFTYTRADGTVTQRPPAGPPKAGDVFEIDSLDFRGDHQRHAKVAATSDYLRCTFLPSPSPTATATSPSMARCCASTTSMSSEALGAT